MTGPADRRADRAGWRAAGLTVAAMGYLEAVQDRQPAPGEPTSYATVDRIAADLVVSRGTAQQYLAALTDAGWIVTGGTPPRLTRRVVRPGDPEAVAATRPVLRGRPPFARADPQAERVANAQAHAQTARQQRAKGRVADAHIAGEREITPCAGARAREAVDLEAAAERGRRRGLEAVAEAQPEPRDDPPSRYDPADNLAALARIRAERGWASGYDPDCPRCRVVPGSGAMPCAAHTRAGFTPKASP